MSLTDYLIHHTLCVLRRKSIGKVWFVKKRKFRSFLFSGSDSLRSPTYAFTNKSVRSGTKFCALIPKCYFVDTNPNR